MVELLLLIENRQLRSCPVEAVWTNHMNGFMVSNYKLLTNVSLW